MSKSDAQLLRKSASAGKQYSQISTPGKKRQAGKRFHFIGAGGIGRSGLAKLLIKHGAIVRGSDQSQSRTVEKLCRLGADIKIGHKPF